MKCFKRTWCEFILFKRRTDLLVFVVFPGLGYTLFFPSHEHNLPPASRRQELLMIHFHPQTTHPHFTSIVNNCCNGVDWENRLWLTAIPHTLQWQLCLLCLAAKYDWRRIKEWGRCYLFKMLFPIFRIMNFSSH